jgi:hypothetical protein
MKRVRKKGVPAEGSEAEVAAVVEGARDAVAAAVGIAGKL